MAQVNENNTNQAVEKENKATTNNQVESTNKKKKTITVKAKQFMNFGKIGGLGRNLWFEKDEVRKVDVTDNERLKSILDNAVENDFLEYVE